MEALQGNGPVMNDSASYSSDRRVVGRNFFGIFHGKIGNYNLSKFKDIGNHNARTQLLDKYTSIVKQYKSENKNEFGFGPNYILNGVMLAITPKTVTLAVGPSFGALVIRNNKTVYSYNPEEPSKELFTLRKNDYILLCSPGIWGSYYKKERADKVASLLHIAITEGHQLLSQVDNLKQQVETEADSRKKAVLDLRINELLPLNADLTVQSLELGCDRLLRTQLYSLLKEVQKSNSRGNLSCILIKINADNLKFNSPIILDSKEVNEQFKN
jgi:hypothetical protein